MDSRALKADGLLLLTAAIWGFAFVAQRAGMLHVGPFTFNAARFALGGLVLLPIYLLRRRGIAARGRATNEGGGRRGVAGQTRMGDEAALPAARAAHAPHVSRRPPLWAALLAGLALFLGATFQQTGLVYTTAGKAGFITGLYVLIVPLIGLFWRQRAGWGTWLGALCAAVGLYLLSIHETSGLARGDALVLIGAFCWAAHVLLIGWLAGTRGSLELALLQYAACAGLSLVAALLSETITTTGLSAAAIPILYGGLFSVGLAFTLQVVAQRRAPAAHAAILMSLEAVFAALGGGIMLAERLSTRALLGCALMLAGVLLSQLTRLARATSGPSPPATPGPPEAAGVAGGVACGDPLR